MSFQLSNRIMRPTLFLRLLLAILAALLRGTDKVSITPDVVYGHKYGLAMTFDVFTPKVNPNGAGILFMVSGGWYSKWVPPEQLTGN